MTVDALFRQAGVIRTDTMHELFDVGVAAVRASRVPAGPAGGDRDQRRAAPGSSAPTPARPAGLEVVELPEQVRDRLARVPRPARRRSGTRWT